MKLPVQAHEPIEHEPASRAAVMLVWLPWPLQHFVSQNRPMESPSHTQEPAEHEFASRAAAMLVWLPRPLHPHSVSQNSPMKLPEQTQEPASPPTHCPLVPQSNRPQPVVK